MSACSTRIKTCQTCATAKIRCLRSSGQTICDRCLRLNKPCYFRPARARQAWSKKDSRLESLEKRVDELLGNSEERSISNSSPQTEKSGDVIDNGLVSLDDAAALLDSYIQFMMPHFPFVLFPAQTTAAELREHRPFLFLAILSVAMTNDHALQRALDKELRTAVAERTVLGRVPSSLETLQGILVVLAWSQHQIRQRFPPRDFSIYLHLAIGLVVDLELDRPVEAQIQCRRMSVHDRGAEVHPVGILRAGQRAAIGCSLLSSSFAIIIQKQCTLPWSSHLEAVALELAHNPEYTSDQVLVHLVRLQHLFERIDKTYTENSLLDISRSGNSGHFNYQETFRTFQHQLQDYTTQLSHLLTPDNFILAVQLRTVNMYLCQVSLFDKQYTNHLPPSLRMEILCHGLAVASSLFQSLAGLQIGTERFMSYTQWRQLGFNIVLSCKLAMMALSDEALRHEYPQVQSLYDELDMPLVLKNTIGRQLAQQQNNDPRLTGFDYTGWLQGIQEWFNRQRSKHQSQAKSSRSTYTAGIAPIPVDRLSHAGNLETTEVYSQDLGLPVTSAEVLSWPSMPDILAVDNPLYGWMDWGSVSL